MDSRTMKFHEVHGENIRLSPDGSEAVLTDLGQGLCFTSRPLSCMESLILKVNPAFRVPGGDIRVGLTRKDPHKLRGKLPQYLRDGEDTDLCGRKLLTDNSHVRLEKDIIIDLNPFLGVTIGNSGGVPEKLLTGIDANESFYLVFDLFVNTDKISIRSTNKFSVARPLTVYQPQNVPTSRSFPNLIVEPARFSRLQTSKVKVTPHLAASADTSACDDNFAFVETPLRANSALIVELTALKRTRPLRIILADEKSVRMQNYNGHSREISFTRFFVMESAMPTAGEELALSISDAGLVGVNHGNRGWSSRLIVNPAFRYHVLFDMQSVSVLSMVGITTGEERIAQSSEIVPKDAPTSKSTVLPECIVCLENPRAFILMPCFHIALCETCFQTLAGRQGAMKCPVCRMLVNRANKVYMA